MDNKALLNEEIQSEFERLKKMEIGSEEHKIAVEGVTKLMDRAIELDKLEQEQTDKQEQMKEDKKDRLIKNCLTGAGIIIPSIITVWGTIKSINFEKDGTITTIMGRGFISKLLPKK